PGGGGTGDLKWHTVKETFTPLDYIEIADRHVGIGGSVRHAVAGEAVPQSEEISARQRENGECRRIRRTPLRCIHARSEIDFGNQAKWRRLVEAVSRWLGQLGQFIERR